MVFKWNVLRVLSLAIHLIDIPMIDSPRESSY